MAYTFLFGPVYHIHTLAPWAPSFIIFAATSFGLITFIAALLFLLIHHDREFMRLSHMAKLRRKINEIMLVFGSTLFSWMLVVIMKWVVASPRPFLYFADVNPLFIYGSYDSFPSGHAAFFGALAAAITLYHPRVGALFFLAGLAISMARVAAGIHFPIDILGGFALGCLISYGTYHTLIHMLPVSHIHKKTARE